MDRFRQILKRIMQTKLSMGTTLRGASFAMTEAKYAAGDFRHTVFDNVETVRAHHLSPLPFVPLSLSLYLCLSVCLFLSLTSPLCPSLFSYLSSYLSFLFLSVSLSPSSYLSFLFLSVSLSPSS